MTVTIRHASRPALFALLVAFLARAAVAQSPELKPKAIAQIADQVLNTLVPPDSSVSRVPVSKRGVYFDHARTLAAFGYGASGGAPQLELRTAVRPGAKALLDDCEQLGRKPCNSLGWSVYVWIEPIAVTDSETSVRVWVLWPDRGRAPYLQGITPTGRAILVGFGRDVYFVHTPDGGWKLARLGGAVVG